MNREPFKDNIELYDYAKRNGLPIGRCPQNESGLRNVVNRQRAPTATDHGLVAGGHLLVEDQCALCLVCPPLRRITKPTGRTFDLQDHRVRAAVREALKNVAYASSAQPRGSVVPIRAKPLYCQFDLPVRRQPIGRSARTNFSLLLSFGSRQLVCMPREPTLGSSSYRKQTVPNCSGLSRQWIFNAFIQSAYFVGVQPFLVHLKKGPPERVSRDLLNCVADCLGRSGKSHIRYGSHRPRSLPAGEQLGSGAIVEKSHFTTPISMPGCKAAHRGSDYEVHQNEKERMRVHPVSPARSCGGFQ